ncbi:hypothetical protein CRYUN_Cryun14cG0099500 [Craigia yunnanensis]
MRYGYKDEQDKQEPIEKHLVEKLKEFITEDFLLSHSQTTLNDGDTADEDVELQSEIRDEKKAYENLGQQKSDQKKVQEALGREIEVVEKASQAGIFHLFGENEVSAGKGARYNKEDFDRLRLQFLKEELEAKR